ncbi:secG [Wigglesworthia glossinidia endosymbiont of Glossina brevipalpis]|uniref:Protein-export membrane protein SecG n=1 Tax=Wigglesworthia glossinidia brevipalpis TaxID=36870 RepID=Q8D2X4_WIGBR|nr:secG [Wigglesworthia glossinidia endosymbiont of Glossina brevipalpis]
MYFIFLIIFLLISCGLIFLVIIQDEKVYELYSSYNPFSGSIFGQSTSNSFSKKLTSIFAVLFFVFSLILGNINNNNDKDKKWEYLLSSEIHKNDIKKDSEFEKKFNFSDKNKK